MPHRTTEFENLQARYARRITARLSEQADALSPDVSERLRFARARALEHARAMRRAAQPRAVASAVGVGAVAVAGAPRPSPWWVGPLSLLPLLALIAGLVLIQSEHVRRQVAAVAEVDADLLLDDLPPSAYSDPGFVEFLKQSPE
jgi:hypothetical protein